MSLEDLKACERRVRSQNGEDGVIEAIFATIGVTNQFFVEFGCEQAVECNAAHLLEQGWRGLMMDAFRESENPLIEVKREFITAENIQSLLEKYDVPRRFDLLSIDVDGNDFWIWQAITHQPRVVVIEYNAHYSPFLARTIPYHPTFAAWNRTDYFGASLLALKELGRRKGYALVYCESTGTNAFFVAEDALPADFDPPPIDQVFRPPNYNGTGGSWPHDHTRQMIDPFLPADPAA